MPYLTPQTLPGRLQAYRVVLPDDSEARAVFLGAFLELAREYNWELFGAATPAEMAALFDECFIQTSQLRLCMQPGIVVHSASATIPDGFLLCDGSAYSVDDYPLLAQAIGYQWGGAGSIFNVPNLDGDFILSDIVPGNIGSTGGAASVTLTTNEMPAHNHSIPGTLTTLNEIPIGTTPVLTPNPVGSLTGSTGNGNPHENMPPYTKLLPLISTGQ